jgi:hypothetical protein
VLGYVSLSEEANGKPVEVVWEYRILCSWTDPGYPRKDKN